MKNIFNNGTEGRLIKVVVKEMRAFLNNFQLLKDHPTHRQDQMVDRPAGKKDSGQIIKECFHHKVGTSSFAWLTSAP